MTREGLIERIEKVEKDNLSDFKPFTQQVFHCTISSVYDNNEGEEREILTFILYDLKAILEIMRHDIVDHDVLSRIKFLIEKRLETIRKEKLS